MALTEVVSPIALQPGATYYAKIQLTGAEDTFGSASDVADKFTELGFQSVSVWTAAPAVFPDRTPYAGGTTYWARGVYSGAARTVGLPTEIKRAWIDSAAQPAPAPPGGYTPPPNFVGPPEPGWNWPIAPDNPTPPGNEPSPTPGPTPTSKPPSQSFAWLTFLVGVTAASWLTIEFLRHRHAR